MRSAWERWESFWVGGRQRGAVLRCFDGALLITRTAFDDGVGSPFMCESLVRLSPNGDTWSGFRYGQEPGGLRSGAWREECGHGADTLPSSGEYLLVERLVRSGRETGTFRRVDEANPSAPAAPAEVHRRGVETIDLPEGRSLRAERWEVLAGGVRAGAWWAHDGELVRSAFGGALTFACREATALEGLDQPLGDFLRGGFGKS
ncbi:hypothetical protein [Sinomonas humi]|uniref:Uncharacterized protein n=1 Tax=Sinomonas humi TaxID=1338436 RepID=A0A0B2AHN5_9MICC|nr:hypothetical protein [Sinomonas humi]KHL03067.1 hypothetical protein LK10_09740 [Sinomonas humi]